MGFYHTHTHTHILPWNLNVKLLILLEKDWNDILLLESVILRLLDIRAAVINCVNGYSHLPRDQTPSQYHSITDGVPGVPQLRGPQDMTEITLKTA